MNEPRLRSHVLHSRSAHAVSRGAFAVLNGVQDIDHPADQLIGTAAAFKYLAMACGFHPHELLAVVDRMERDCMFREENTLSAVAKYAENEVGRKLN